MSHTNPFVKFMYKTFMFIFRPSGITKKNIDQTRYFASQYFQDEIVRFKQLDKYIYIYIKESKKFPDNIPKKMTDEIKNILPNLLLEDAPKSQSIRVGKTVFMISLSGYSNANHNTKLKIDRAKELCRKEGFDFLLITKNNILDYVVIPKSYQERVKNFLSKDTSQSKENHWSNLKDKDTLIALLFLGTYIWSGTYLNMKYGGICMNDSVLLNDKFSKNGKKVLEYILSKRYLSPAHLEYEFEDQPQIIPLNLMDKGKFSLELNSSNSSYHPLFAFTTTCALKLFEDPNISLEDKIKYNKNFLIGAIFELAFKSFEFAKLEQNSNIEIPNRFFNCISKEKINKFVTKEEFMDDYKEIFAARIYDRNSFDMDYSMETDDPRKKRITDWLYS